jgi:hypothetical protein
MHIKLLSTTRLAVTDDRYMYHHEGHGDPPPCMSTTMTKDLPTRWRWHFSLTRCTHCLPIGLAVYFVKVWLIALAVRGGALAYAARL